MSDDRLSRAVNRFIGAEGVDDPSRQAARRLGDAMRDLIDRLAGLDAPAEELTAAAEQIEAVVGTLADRPRWRQYEGFAESANAGTMEALFDHSPILGPANPLAPPLRVWQEGQSAVGTVTFGAAYEGPPGCVHGGYVAATFDEILGMAESLSGKPGMTGTLTVRYRKPTPLHELLRFEGELVRVEGRKIFTVGRCLHNGVLTAEAEAIFVSLDPTRFAELTRARGATRPDPGAG